MVQKGTIIFTLLHGRHHGQGTVLRMMPNCPILNLNTPIVQGSSPYEANAISLMGLNLGLWTMLVPGPQGSNRGYVQVSNIDIEQARVVPEFGEQSRLTVLSYDLVNSTSILATSDLEDYQDLIAAFQRMVCGAVANAGGSSPEIAGDGGVASLARVPMLTTRRLLPLKPDCSASKAAGYFPRSERGMTSCSHRDCNFQSGR